MRRMHTFLALVLAAAMLPACVSSDAGSDWPEGGDVILRGEVQRRIQEMPYLHGVAFVHNLERLAQIGEPAVPQLREAAKDPQPTVRMGTAWVFGAMGDRRQIAVLRGMLEDTVSYVRYEAASGLVELGDATGFPVLVDGLASDEIGDRYKCFEALHEVTGQDFGYRHDADPTLRRAAVARWLDWLDGIEATGL